MAMCDNLKDIQQLQRECGVEEVAENRNMQTQNVHL
jgi:hypothetical protein